MALYDKKALKNGLKWQVLVASSEPKIRVRLIPHKKVKFALMVKWISQSTSDRLLGVRIFLGAPLKALYLGTFSDFYQSLNFFILD